MHQRIESLDWLRGLMAISIMMYHLVSWLYFPLDASSLLGRLGIYGVSIFFILSGLSMAIVYSSYFPGEKTFLPFFIRRIFRIWPLLWICVALATIPALAGDKEVSLIKIAANLTTLFGFIKPDFYINTGAWSIGNEMVYYAMTPFILTLYARNLLFGNLALLVTLSASLFFAFILLNPELSLTQQWKIYINPFNNLFLYVSGIAIYFNLKEVQLGSISVAILLIISTAFFLSYPVSGDTILIVTGINRILFMAACIMLVVSFFKFCRLDLVPYTLRFPLEQLGIATYGVYLLHPLILNYLNEILQRIGIHNLPPSILLVGVIILTIAASLLSFNLFEKRIIQIGKRIAPGFSPAEQSPGVTKAA